MEREESLKFLNKCLKELQEMSDEEFEKRCEEVELNEDIEFIEDCIEKDNFVIIS